MKALMIGLAFVGYTIGTWGYVLVKGYNISLVEWVTPLHPFNGPLAAAGDVPVGHIFPPGGASNATNSGGSGQAAGKKPKLNKNETSGAGTG